MNISSEEMKEFFEKLLSGDATAEEKELLQRLMQKSNIEIDANQLLSYNDWESAIDTELPANMRERVLGRILKEQEPPVELLAAEEKLKLISQRKWWYAAAVILILLSGTWIFKNQQADEVAWITETTANGQRKIIVLPDSSRVQLNAGSELKYPSVFAGSERRIALQGEAFFEVTRNSSQAFIVQTNALQTTVLGTSFNVQAYQPDSMVVVTVSSGKVKVEIEHSDNKNAILPAGFTARYSLRKDTLEVGNADTAAAAGWIRGLYIFKDESLSSICSVLEREYKVHFCAANPALLSCKYAITIDKLNIDEVINKLNLFGDIVFTRKGGTVMISGSPCN